LPGLGQPSAQRPLAPAELEGRLRGGLFLQVAEDDRQAVAIGQPIDLLV
jgi:hypothetical protein